MRAGPTSRLLAWRWAPCAALTLGATLFVVLAVTLIPDHFATATGQSERPLGAANDEPAVVAPPSERSQAERSQTERSQAERYREEPSRIPPNVRVIEAAAPPTPA